MKDSVDFDLSYANNFDALRRLSRSLADTVTEVVREHDPKAPKVTIELQAIKDKCMAADVEVVFWRVGAQ